MQDNIDTDQIIPSREMKTVSKLGLGQGLFAGWRYHYNGRDKAGLQSDFVLNQDAYKNSSILLGGKNFGCGSSREHAVWALRDFGIRAIIAESFGRIFRNNCARNGVLAISLPEPDIVALAAATGDDPQRTPLTVDLERQVVELEGGLSLPFRIEAFDRSMLLEGLDYVDYTLQFEDDLERFLKMDRALRPWAHVD